MMSSSRDSVVSTHTSWVCTSRTELREVLITPQEDLITEAGLDPSASALCEPVRLERAEESSPCVLTLLCRPNSGAVISSLQIVSEARTVEVYSLSGDYCGTSRGQEDPRWERSSDEDKRLFFRSHLVLESPLASCDVKLLSLGGRSAVEIRQVVVGLRFHPGTEIQPGPGAGIDLHRVQAMMEEMGTTLSPGAQNLMEMVQFQQKNKADVLGGFLPLLMGGGALACLAKGSKAAGDVGADGGPGLTGHQTGMLHPNQSGVPDAIAGAPRGTQSPVSPDLLPMLQNVCGQVTQLRLDALTSPEKKTNGEQLENHVCCGGLEKVLEKVVEKRMYDLESRLKEHMDSRLDALQQRLELTLHQLTLLTSTSNPH